MATLIFNKELHTSTNILVFNMAIADFFISGFVDGFTIVGKLFSKKKRIAKFLNIRSFRKFFLLLFQLFDCIKKLILY